MPEPIKKSQSQSTTPNPRLWSIPKQMEPRLEPQPIGGILTMQTIARMMQAWDSKGRGDCLSVCLESDATTGTWLGKLYELRLIFDKLGRSLDNDERKNFLITRSMVDNFLKTYDPDSRALFMVAGSAGFWWHTEIEVRLPTEVKYNFRPYVAPLVTAIDNYGSYCVAIVDNENARLLHVQLREIDKQVEVHDRVPKRHKQIEHNARIERKHADKVQKHLENAIEELDALHKAEGFSLLILAGAPEAMPKFEEALPQHLKKLVADRFPASIKDGNKQIIDRAESIRLKAEQDREQQTVEDLITRSAKKQLAVLGLDSTLIHLHHKEVFRLITVKEYPARGSVCTVCSFATTAVTTTCALCNSRTLIVDDLLQEAFHLALLKGVPEIQVVSSENARSRLTDAGGLGAFLKIPTNR